MNTRASSALASDILFGIWVWGALAYPMIEWQIHVGSGHRAPLSDLLMMVGWIVWCIIFFRMKILRSLPIPVLISFLLFLFFALLSIINAPNVLLSVQYVLRFIVLNFLLYFLLPLQVIQSPPRARMVSWLLIVIAVAAGIMGLVSILLQPEYMDFTRAMPLRIGGIFPFGKTPNLLAEIFVPIIPIFWAMGFRLKTETGKELMFGLLCFVVVVALLTFSRAAWIALAFEAAAIIWVQYRKELGRFMLKFRWLVLLVVLPMIILMLKFLYSPIIHSSNENRLYLQEISWMMFERHPFLGSGIGTFIEQVWSEKYYQLQFGTALDAHGIPQKLLAETGVLGLLTFLGFIGSIIFVMWESKRNLKSVPDQKLCLAYIVGLLGLVLTQLLNTTYFTAKLWFPMGVGLAVCLTLAKHRHANAD